ncbi:MULTISPECIES: hypothetical protein [unclassified Pseudomonas]|jgi:hypothetical protein|uniref:hypothetical protein n=1 Tax=Pseudomonas TaxID=286 RepID=UPI001160350B|nr:MULTISPECIES: hypothetical protein [unclassified Pseudomonas]MCD4867104.1 hypothetical protein [Pseudomonas sp. PLB05]
MSESENFFEATPPHYMQLSAIQDGGTRNAHGVADLHGIAVARGLISISFSAVRLVDRYVAYRVPAHCRE